MYLNRVEFLKFVSCGLVDCKLRFEQATIEYLIREMKTQNRLFFSLLKEEEQHIQHFAKLWQLREYGQSVKIATSVADGNWEAKDHQPHTNDTTTSNHNNTNNNNNNNNSSSNISWSRANSAPQKVNSRIHNNITHTHTHTHTHAHTHNATHIQHTHTRTQRYL